MRPSSDARMNTAVMHTRIMLWRAHLGCTRWGVRARTRDVHSRDALARVARMDARKDKQWMFAPEMRMLVMHAPEIRAPEMHALERRVPKMRAPVIHALGMHAPRLSGRV